MTTVKGTAMTAYAPIETAAAAANWQPATGQPIPMSPLMVHLASTHVVVVVAVRWATTSDQFTTQKATASMLASMHTPMLTPTNINAHLPGTQCLLIKPMYLMSSLWLSPLCPSNVLIK